MPQAAQSIPPRPSAVPPTPPGTISRRGVATLEDARRSFLRMVSHELRTPLNSIIGFSEIIACELYGPLGAPQYREYADLVRESGLKMLALVNQVLEIIRLESGAADLDCVVQNLDDAVNDALEALAVEPRGVRLQVEGPTAALPPVVADHRALRTVLGALLQNAFAFSPDGGTVRLRAHRRSGVVEIEIEDEGKGVDPDDIPRLMRPFEQGENALTRRTQGAGLGLPIADQLCAAQGGGLALRCEPGRGLVAQVRLPAA